MPLARRRVGMRFPRTDAKLVMPRNCLRPVEGTFMSEPPVTQSGSRELSVCRRLSGKQPCCKLPEGNLQSSRDSANLLSQLSGFVLIWRHENPFGATGETVVHGDNLVSRRCFHLPGFG